MRDAEPAEEAALLVVGLVLSLRECAYVYETWIDPVKEGGIRRSIDRPPSKSKSTLPISFQTSNCDCTPVTHLPRSRRPLLLLRQPALEEGVIRGDRQQRGGSPSQEGDQGLGPYIKYIYIYVCVEGGGRWVGLRGGIGGDIFYVHMYVRMGAQQQGEGVRVD